MNLRTPATSFVAALDEPWRFLRTRFSMWAPAAFALAAMGVVPAVLVQWFMARLTHVTPGAMPDLVSLVALFPALFFFMLAYVATQLGAFVIATRVLAGERPNVGDVLATALSPRMLLVGGVPLLLVLAGFGCVVGGPVAAALVGFAPAAVLARPGVWFSTWGEAFAAATVRASPRDAGPPGLKLAAITLVWYGVNSVAGQLAAIPSLGWFVWSGINALGSGDILGALQSNPPFAIGATGVILGAALRPFADIFLAAGVVLLWRDLERVRGGEDLEALVDGRAT
ncbi:MAG: hypothetical protein Q8P18_18990 [Pseudomonadota bacterium]|nr:hypothetical protein [Pseudomonadota bacterium]